VSKLRDNGLAAAIRKRLRAFKYTFHSGGGCTPSRDIASDPKGGRVGIFTEHLDDSLGSR
jgi:hypothetical protein